MDADRDVDKARPSRRSVLGMWTGLLGCLAASGHVMESFLLPAKHEESSRKMYIGLVSDMPKGSSRKFAAPSGEAYLLTRTSAGIVAFSETCPHLGCNVHWKAKEQSFYCPCHAGEFAADGKPIAGPPKDENTPLKQLDLVVEGNAIYALVPVA